MGPAVLTLLTALLLLVLAAAQPLQPGDAPLSDSAALQQPGPLSKMLNAASAHDETSGADNVRRKRFFCRNCGVGGSLGGGVQGFKAIGVGLDSNGGKLWEDAGVSGGVSGGVHSWNGPDNNGGPGGAPGRPDAYGGYGGGYGGPGGYGGGYGPHWGRK